MASNNMINNGVDPNIEDELFAREVEAVKKWWSDPRWRNTKRAFTAEQIVSKRGHLQVEYPSNAQSKKLWTILEGRFKVSCLWRVESRNPGVLTISRTKMPAIRTAA
jgi:isocitrate lyase